jgi:predicted permease
MRSFWQLSNVDAGYNTENIFTFQIAANRPDLNDRASMSRFQYAFMDRLKGLPGVESVGYITTLPLDEGAGSQNITTPTLEASGAEAPLVRVAGAGGAYFQTMGIDLVRGRFFDRVEEEQGLRFVIISQSAAELLFPGEDPIDKQVRPATGGPNWFSIIGVVEDVLVDDLRRDSPEPMVYLPAVSGSPAYVMKSTRAEQLEPEVRAIVREVIPTSPMYRIFTMKRLAAKAMADLSFTMLMVSLAAVLALVLGAVGLYGVLSYRVTKRVREIGVRMALGAEASGVRRMFVWQGGRVALIGIAVGALTAVALTTYIQTLLFGVGRLDVFAFVGTSAVMLGVALLASYVPALRASRVDPVVALRAE